MRKAPTCFSLLLLFETAAAQDRRVALVVGNANYATTAKLANPGNDAADIAAALKKVGFDVLVGNDLGKAGMDTIIRSFSTSLKDASAGLFFYAGHGMQVAGQNYLVPVDAKLEDESALDFEMVRLDLVQRAMERNSRTNVIILDACRDNPLARNLARSLGTRSTQVGRGLAIVESGEGTLISFSTQPGNVALDGTGRNSPFADALLKHIESPGDDLSAILINVRTDVMNATGRKQVPWEHSALTSRFYFTPPKADAKQAQELKLWNDVKNSTNPTDIQRYLRRYPNGVFAVVAQTLATALADQQTLEAAIRDRKAAQTELDRARDEVRKAQDAIKAAEKTAVPKSGTVMAAIRSAENPFDGVWNLETFGGQFCPVKHNTGSWIISKHAIKDAGRGEGKVSANGLLTYSQPGTANPSVTVQFEAVLSGDKGKGTYRVQGGKCTGTVSLVRK